MLGQPCDHPNEGRTPPGVGDYVSLNRGHPQVRGTGLSGVSLSGCSGGLTAGDLPPISGSGGHCLVGELPCVDPWWSAAEHSGPGADGFVATARVPGACPWAVGEPPALVAAARLPRGLRAVCGRYGLASATPSGYPSGSVGSAPEQRDGDFGWPDHSFANGSSGILGSRSGREVVVVGAARPPVGRRNSRESAMTALNPTESFGPSTPGTRVPPGVTGPETHVICFLLVYLISWFCFVTVCLKYIGPQDWYSTWLFLYWSLLYLYCSVIDKIKRRVCAEIWGPYFFWRGGGWCVRQWVSARRHPMSKRCEHSAEWGTPCGQWVDRRHAGVRPGDSLSGVVWVTGDTPLDLPLAYR